MKIAGSGSISQRHRSADPDPDPYLHQNVMDPQHWFGEYVNNDCVSFSKKKKEFSEDTGLSIVKAGERRHKSKS